MRPNFTSSCRKYSEVMLTIRSENCGNHWLYSNGLIVNSSSLILLYLVIGDEILRGEVADTNACYAAAGLHNLGVKLKKVNDF